MIIARIIGTVVASQKDERLEGKKLLIVRPINLDGSDTSGYVVAVDTVGAGFHERVLVVAGSSARLAQNMKDAPVDAAAAGKGEIASRCVAAVCECDRGVAAERVEVSVDRSGRNSAAAVGSDLYRSAGGISTVAITIVAARGASRDVQIAGRDRSVV